MTITKPKDLSVLLLSEIRDTSVRETAVYRELSQSIQTPTVKASLEARVFLAESTVRTLDECFRLLGHQPLNKGKLPEILTEDFRKEIAEIQNPTAKHLYILARLLQLTHLRIGQYAALVAATEATGDHAVGVLLESCLAQYQAFGERTRRLITEFNEKTPLKSAA